ncbi:cupin domain-containing protein [Rhodospirillaceae bacterium SYSU D60014]|uniref:cupin domain-containing protein n=1 Tax=Virgifigura deserti TaxID=2268457 RepID=UPI000E66E6AC
MRLSIPVIAATVLLAGTAFAQENLQEIDKPASQLEQVLAQEVKIPADAREVRVVRATVEPRTVAGWHTHPTPVYVYVVDGTLTMEVEGKEPRTIMAGEAVAEPLNAPMRVSNEGDQPVELVVFQISPPQKQFLEQNEP